MGYHSHLRPSSAFYAHFTRPRSTTRPNAVWTTYSSPRSSSDEPCMLCRAQWTRQLMLEHLDKARSGASPLRERFMSATATSLRSPPHPLQMCRSNLSTTSLHLGSRLARSWSSHTRALVMRFLIMLSVPEGWWSGGCGVPALHLKRGERGRVPASRRAYGALRDCLKKWPTTLRASGERKKRLRLASRLC